MEDSVRLARDLARVRPEAHEKHLSESLNMLSIRLSKLGRHGEALAVIEECVGLARKLGRGVSETHNIILAQSLCNLSNYLSDVQRHDDALAAIEEAVGLMRKFANDRPAAHNWELAHFLINFSLKFRDLSRFEDALDPVLKAVQLGRELVGDGPPEATGQFRLDLQNSLQQMWECLEMLGRHEEARAARKEEAILWSESTHIKSFRDKRTSTSHATLRKSNSVLFWLPARRIHREVFQAGEASF
jgi:tetratricopeptide (TPR) repeat protein